MLGSELAGLDDAAVGEIADRGIVFAKLTPDDKVRIVRALRARGHTVGFMGDGINDAGALREADVGISVDSAVDIAKESADIILLEKSLMVLEEGVIEGRKTFGNTIKYIKMTASSNFGNVFSVLVASAFLPFLPMLPMQLLTVNLLYDFSQASIPWDDMDPEYLTGPAAMARRRHRPLHDLHRPDQLDLRHLHLRPDVVRVRRERAGAAGAVSSRAGSSSRLLTQTLIVHMIRTAKVPFIQSRAAWPVLILTTVIMICGMVVPFTSLGTKLGLHPCRRATSRGSPPFSCATARSRRS